jgi:hypothetical protein
MSAGARPLLRITGLEGLALAALFCAAATSGYVFQEPAPHDVVLAGLICAFVAAGLAVPRGIAPLAVLLTLYVIGSFIAGARASDVDGTMAHSLVTFYLAGSAVFYACVAAWSPVRALDAIFAGTLVAAVIAAVAGIGGYFNLVPGADGLFELYGRARGTFKDPNVFGPFLVLPLLYVGCRVMAGRLAALALWGPIGAILLLGLLLSFSRGAWLNFAVAATVFILIATTALGERALSRRAGLLAMAGVVVMACGLAWAAGSDRIADLLSERAHIAQDYDTGATGRFAGQAVALGVIVAEPLGIGHGGFARYHPEQPHNVYLNTFLNSGWLGGMSYLVLVLATFMRALTLALRRGPAQPFAIVLGATFIGLMVEGFVVDTDHWRHFMAVTGLIWGAGAAAPTAPGRMAPSRPPQAGLRSRRARVRSR